MVSYQSMRFELARQASVDTILVVEDDEDSREMLTVCIESETSYRVMSLPSAEEALQRLLEIKEVKPHLFIFDFYLVSLTGLDLYDSLHSMKEFEHVPAIILTAATVDLELESVIARRKLTLLPKPFDIDELLSRIEQLLIGPGQLI